MNPNFPVSDYKELKNGLERDKIHQQIKQLLQTQLYGILTTSYKKQPYTSLLAFIASKDIKFIYVATGRNTYKFHNVKENEKIAFFVDNRSNDTFDVSNAYALTVFGKAEVINKNETTNIKNLYLKKHPQLDSFINSKNVEFLRIKISSFSFVERFQNVYLLEMDDEKNNSTR